MAKVFVNGVFDLLHVGHLRLLEFARSYGDILVVGINSDSSVRESKGKSRPVIPQSERMEMLLGVIADEVIVFDDKTPLNAIKGVRPGVLIVGFQYADNCESSEYVRSYGGRVVVAPRLAGTSTTGIIERIKEA